MLPLLCSKLSILSPSTGPKSRLAFMLELYLLHTNMMESSSKGNEIIPDFDWHFVLSCLLLDQVCTDIKWSHASEAIVLLSLAAKQGDPLSKTWWLNSNKRRKLKQVFASHSACDLFHHPSIFHCSSQIWIFNDIFQQEVTFWPLFIFWCTTADSPVVCKSFCLSVVFVTAIRHANMCRHILTDFQQHQNWQVNQTVNGFGSTIFKETIRTTERDWRCNWVLGSER